MTFARRVLTGTAYLTLSSGSVRLLSIVLMPIVTRLLSPQAYGVASLAGTVISLATAFALAGLDVTYARAYHSVQPPNGRVVEQFCWRVSLLGATVTAAIAGGAWLWLGTLYAEFNSAFAVFVALGIVAAVANTMAQVRARLASGYRRMALAIVVSGIVGAAANIAIAVWWRQDAVALLASMLLGYLTPALLLGAPPVSDLAETSILTREEGLSLIKIGLAAVVTAPMYWLVSSSDRWFLQYYRGAETVGLYSIGYNVASIGVMANAAIMSVWLPEASREYEQDPERAKAVLGHLMSRLVAAMALIWLVAASAGGDLVRWLAGERFHASADCIPFIAGGVFFYGVSQLGLYALVLVKRLKWAAAWWLGGGLGSAVLNAVLVPRFGAIGAAITQSTSFALIALGILATSQRLFRLELSWGRLITVLAVVLIAGRFMASPWHAASMLSLLTKLPVGLAVAAVASWAIAPDWVARGVALLRRSGRVSPR